MSAVRTPPDHRGMHRILLAYREGESARRALYAAAQLARALHAQVGVISVIPLYPDRGRKSIAPWDDHDVHRDDLLEAQAVFRASGIEPDLIECVGEPGERIDRASVEDGYDTIVLGSGRKGFLGWLAGGGVARNVLERTTATVVTVP
jgi:nucleotide-binding universal stress UspA family protein